jgi:two-component system, NarL family, response regulator NreC
VGSGIKAVEATPRLELEIVIVDVAIKELNGIEATAQILKHLPETAVLILSMYSDESYVRASRQSRARAYVLKNFAGEELI